MLDIYRKYNDMYFTSFTNGTLFDEKLAQKLVELGNVMPMFSIEGWKKETDERRGSGIYDLVINMFMPVGDSPVEEMNYMLSPEGRIYLGRRNRQIRTSKKIFTIDFFNDAPYVGGCISGKCYCHINSKEDVEPCIFSHFAVTNVKNKSLIDAFKSPYFKSLRANQPYNKNLLMPCPMIDDPQYIRNIVKETWCLCHSPQCRIDGKG